MEYSGTVANGMVVLDNGQSLPDGTRVRVTVAEAPSPGESLRQLLLEFAGVAKGLPSDMAENHDHYLHGLPKK